LKPPFDPRKITIEALNQFRFATDPLADKVISQIIGSGHEKQINQILMTLMRSDTFQKGIFSALGQTLSDTLDNYIEVSSKLPDWADPQLIRRGEQLFELHGPEVFMLLNMSSLPMCYCCGNGAQVLYDTGRLLSRNGKVDQLARRLMETAQMIVNVLSLGGLSVNGRGIVTLQKVRLIHASIRYFLKLGQAGIPWDTAKFGEPINQEDLAGTLMSFGPVILTGLKKLGINLTDDDTLAWMHCWNVTGHLLGIDESFLPDTHQQGFQLATDILIHQAEYSDAGVALTHSCIQFINSIVPGNAFNGVPAYFMSYFLEDFKKASGKDLNACIGISSDGDLEDRLVFELAHFVTKTLSKEEARSIFVRKIATLFNKLLLQGIIYYFNGEKSVQFFIPPSLQTSWGVSDLWDDHKTSPSILGNRLAWQKKRETLK
jgi:hypothetical protein